ncbi:zinc-binding alcohol dehydrogenase family protein [soil metagenome]
MEAIILQEPGKFVYTHTPALPAPGPGEALVKVHRVGICGTDYHAYRGRQPFFSYPRILGHELGVEVVEVGEAVLGLSPGDQCAVEPYLHCGHCSACRQGKTNCCLHLQVLGVHTDGGLRSFLQLPAPKLHRSPKLSLEQLALVETLGIGAHAVDRAQVTEQDTVVVIGAGPIGLSVVAFAQLAGARVVVADVEAGRLAFCANTMGVEATVRVAETAPLEQIREIFGGDLPSVVFDATGNLASMTKSFGWVGHGGRLVFVGLFPGEVTFHDPDFHRRELTLLASRNSTGQDFRRIIELMEAGRLDTGPWITHRAAFPDLIRQFDAWLNPRERVIKAMVKLD